MPERAGRERMYTKEDLENGVPIPAPLLPYIHAIRTGQIKGARYYYQPTQEGYDKLEKQLEATESEVEKLKRKIEELERRKP